MTDYLETTIDKFIFRVATDRLYTAEGVWAKAEESQVLIGLSDFVQQHNGDIAFAEIKPPGTVLKTGDEVAAIETIKVNIALGSPVTGRISKINPEIELSPELINQDPYESGWLAVIEASSWVMDKVLLLEPAAYLTRIRIEAEEETRRL